MGNFKVRHALAAVLIGSAIGALITLPSSDVLRGLSIDVRLASSSAESGQSTAKLCLACHSFEKGGPNKQGPNLWGIVNRPRASEPGFSYSPAMKAKGGEWTFEELDKFLTDPKGYIPGTAMGFAGLKRADQRANVINYLHTLADKPVDLPKAAAK